MKKTLILAVLFLCIAVSAQAQTYNLNQPSGTIAIGCSEYINNVNKIWNVNTGQNKAVKITYSLSTEANYDKVTVYSINASGNAILLFTKSGSLSGTAYSEFPTGKIQVVFTTDISLNCSTNPQYSGFIVNFSVDDRVFFDAPIYLSEGTINSYNSSDLNFQTNGTTRMSIINSNGYVGIGTNNPIANLHVYGSVNTNFVLQGPNTRLQIGVATNNTAFAPYSQVGDIVFRPLGTKHGLIFDIPSILNNGAGYIKFGDSYNGGWISIFNNRKMIIDGKLGIGTTNPQNALDVYGSVYLPANNSYWIGSYSDSGNRLRMHHNGNDAYIDYLPNLHFRSDGTTESMILLQNGNVGIGITNPTQKLEVNGTIRAKEIKIETNWADFVFNDNYRLKPLQEVNEYISDNKRLPDIPSEQEVKENGVNLGDMQTKLLQKVEELTLYIIRQQEMIDKLNARIEQLEKK